MNLSTAYKRAEAWGQVELKLNLAIKQSREQRLFATRDELEAALAIITELEKVTVVEIEVKLPRCWNDLVSVQFDEGRGPHVRCAVDRPIMYEGEPVVSGENRVLDSDPRPYYDDSRGRSQRNAEGWVIEVYLLSGQSNYWGHANIYAPNGEHIVESGMWETIEDLNEVEADDGRKFKIKVVWE